MTRSDATLRGSSGCVCVCARTRPPLSLYVHVCMVAYLHICVSVFASVFMCDSVCLPLCICVCVCVLRSLYLCIWVSVSVYICVSVCVSIWACVYMSVYTYVCVCLCICVICVCICVCVRTGVFVYVNMLVAQSCWTLCKSVDSSPPGSSVHGILQVKILQWVAIPFSRGSSQPRDGTWVSCIAGRFFTV